MKISTEVITCPSTHNAIAASAIQARMAMGMSRRRAHFDSVTVSTRNLLNGRGLRFIPSPSPGGFYTCLASFSNYQTSYSPVIITYNVDTNKLFQEFGFLSGRNASE